MTKEEMRKEIEEKYPIGSEPLLGYWMHKLGPDYIVLLDTWVSPNTLMVISIPNFYSFMRNPNGETLQVLCEDNANSSSKWF